MKTQDYTNWTKEQLIEQLKSFEETKKYGLVWVNKKEDVKEKFKLYSPLLSLNPKKCFFENDKSENNIFIEGDNLDSLSILNYSHKGKIDVIYVDPPYNTGATNWKYNNSYVDSEDPYRHSKWISFMYFRLHLARTLLSEEGIICITIDDYEFPRLFMVMEEIFGSNNFLGNVIIRNNPGGRKSKRKVAAQHEYAIFFSKNPQVSVAKIDIEIENKSHKYEKNDKGELIEWRNLRKEGSDSMAKPGSDRFYPIYFDSDTGEISSSKILPIKILPLDSKGDKRIWRRSKDDVDVLFKKNELKIKKTSYGNQVYFQFKGGLSGETPKSLQLDNKFSASEYGTKELDNILGERESFNFPKSKHAVAQCIKIASSKKDAIILDFFAGSGTTGQAVLELNNEDGGNRKFILCTNNENKIADEVCYPRISKIMGGYQNKGGEFIKGLGGNLKYFNIIHVLRGKKDSDKKILANNINDLICLKENTFNKFLVKPDFQIYKSIFLYVVIIHDILSINEVKKELRNLDLPIKIYVFSLGDDDLEDEFLDIKNIVKIDIFPNPLFKTYTRIIEKL